MLNIEETCDDDDEIEKAVLKDLLKSSFNNHFSTDRSAGAKRPTLMNRISGFFGGGNSQVQAPEATMLTDSKDSVEEFRPGSIKRAATTTDFIQNVALTPTTKAKLARGGSLGDAT